ncbi:hypothetical protein WMY93_015232 [Mugilogobius chulae]|uniref:C-type lectin domain-containing protein n=1 Tax=Mugilogobius chulae TaxID=88201 RepID=A0AAW0NPZ8_9GOBI
MKVIREEWSRVVQSGLVWFRVVSCGSDWSRVDQTGLVWFRLVSCGSDWSRVDQTGLVWFRLVSCGSDWSQWFRLVSCGSDWSRVVQTGLVWFRLVSCGSDGCVVQTGLVCSDWSRVVRLVSCGSDWSRVDQTGLVWFRLVSCGSDWSRVPGKVHRNDGTVFTALRHTKMFCPYLCVTCTVERKDTSTDTKPKGIYLVKPGNTWAYGQKICRQNYTDLIQIESEAENLEVMAKAVGHNAVWIDEARVSWSWSDNSSVLFTTGSAIQTCSVRCGGGRDARLESGELRTETALLLLQTRALISRSGDSGTNLRWDQTCCLTPGAAQIGLRRFGLVWSGLALVLLPQFVLSGPGLVVVRHRSVLKIQFQSDLDMSDPRIYRTLLEKVQYKSVSANQEQRGMEDSAHKKNQRDLLQTSAVLV